MIELSQQPGSYSALAPSWIEDAYASSLIEHGRQTAMTDDVRDSLSRVAQDIQACLDRSQRFGVVELARMCLRETLRVLPSTPDYDEARCDMAHTLFTHSHTTMTIEGFQ